MTNRIPGNTARGRSTVSVLLASVLSFAGVLSLGIPMRVEAQQPFPSPEAASKALLKAMRAKDRQALLTIFGPDGKELFSGDPIQDGHGIDLFARGLTTASRIEKRDESTALLHFGKVDWPFPIPIEKKAEGWYFNTAAGKGAIIERRIRNNEEAAKMFTRQYVLAQWEYMRTEDGDKDGVAEFAQKFMSTPGKRDGLYWDTRPGEGGSPLSPVIGYARSQGYGRSPVEGQQQPFQGYYYKILTRQGASASDGAQDFMVNGNLVKGFALVAYPSRYGSSGRMTYLVSHLGKMYEKDLQAETAQIAARMTEFNPDSSWTLTQK